MARTLNAMGVRVKTRNAKRVKSGGKGFLAGIPTMGKKNPPKKNKRKGKFQGFSGVTRKQVRSTYRRGNR